MSTRPSTTAPVAPEWVHRRLRLEQYKVTVQSGIFTTRDRFRLFDGFLVATRTQVEISDSSLGDVRKRAR